MTQITREIKRNPQVNQEAVSFRLPRTQLEWLDHTVEAEGSSRTGVIRAALAIYQRLAKGGTILVPASAKTQDNLRCLSEARNYPAETIAGELLQYAAERCVERDIVTWSVSLTAHISRSRNESQVSRTIPFKELTLR